MSANKGAVVKKKREGTFARINSNIAAKGVSTNAAPEDLLAGPSPAVGTAAVDGAAALRSSIADLYSLGHTLRGNYRFLSATITTSSLRGKGAPKRQKRQADGGDAADAAPVVEDAISADQIWGQLSLLGAPILQDIGVTINRLTSACGVGEASSSTGGKKKKIAFDDDDDMDDEDIDILAEEDEEEDVEDGSGEEDEDDEEGDDEDEDDSDDDSSDEDGLGDEDPELARLMAARAGKSNNKRSAKEALEARRQKALLDFAAGGDDDNGENDEDDWAAEFETRKDDGDGAFDDAEDMDRKPALSKRAQRLKQKYGDDDAGDEDDLDAFGGGDDEEGDEDDEEDGDVMGELYGDEYEGDEAKFMGEDEEDDDVHGTSDEEGEEENALYDAEEDARFQRGMFPTDTDDGFDNILDDREGAFGGANANADDEDEDDEDEDGLTDFQLRQKQEKKFIKTLEQKRAFNADWAMGGEVEGRARPKDSLVDEELDFEHGMKSVPVITEALTAKLEERIKQRILDSNFNDVVRRQAATSAADLTSNGVAKRDTTADAEKSKASLMDLYEKDYLAKLKKMEDAAGMNDQIAEPLTEIEKDELKAIQMWKRLAQHLDALSNYYFTPKPVQEDLNVRVRAVDKAAPAISMESVGAFAVSKAAALAPQDAFRPAQKSMLGNVSLEEMTPRERQALRRSKKDASATTKARIERKSAEKAEKKKRRLEEETLPKRKAQSRQLYQ